MIQVNLKSNWFAPDGDFYKSSRNPHRFPDDWKKLLPKSAEVLGAVDDDEDEEAAKPAKGK